jgi:hypothetical protein
VRVQAPCWIPVGDVRVFANGALLLQVPIDGAPCTGALRYEHGFDASLAAGHAFGTTGPFLAAELAGNGGTAGIGETLAAGSAPVQLHVRVQAPCWMPVGDVRVFANGVLFATIPIDGTPCTSALRYDGSIVHPPEPQLWG